MEINYWGVVIANLRTPARAWLSYIVVHNGALGERIDSYSTNAALPTRLRLSELHARHI